MAKPQDQNVTQSKWEALSDRYVPAARRVTHTSDQERRFNIAEKVKYFADMANVLDSRLRLPSEQSVPQEKSGLQKLTELGLSTHKQMQKNEAPSAASATPQQVQQKAASVTVELGDIETATPTPSR